jgi:hypothetical protein
MRNLLDQLYKTKLQLLAVILTVSGVALLVVVHWIDASHPPHWLTDLPLTDLGSALFTTGLLAVVFEYINRKDGETRTRQQLRDVLRAEAPAIRDAVYDGFAFNSDELKTVASPDTLDRLARNSLAVQLGDRTLAEDVYADLRSQVLRAPERWHDLRVSVNLAPWQDQAADDRNPMFVATVRWEYKDRPASPTLRFACTADLTEYRELLRDPTLAGQWYFEPICGLDASDPAAFAVQVTVNGHDRPIRRTSRAGSQVYTANLGSVGDSGEDLTVAYTYRALVQQRGHMLYLDFPRPTKGLQVQFSYTGSGIHYVNALDHFASAQPVRIEHSPASVPERTIDIGFDGWIFPRSGVAFVWVLEREMAKK